MKLTLPLTLIIPRKTKEDKVFALNLNVYRNTHHQILNQAKVLWKAVVWASVRAAGNWDGMFYTKRQLHFSYTVFPGSNRKFDVGNVLPIVQKFTDDALIELNIIKDDSYKVIPEIDYRFGGVDKDNPRVELEITEIGEAI